MKRTSGRLSLRQLAHFFFGVLVLTVLAGCGTVSFQKSSITGSAYLFGVDHTGTNGVVHQGSTIPSQQAERAPWTNRLPGRLWDPYKVADDGDPVPTNSQYQVTLNRVWLRHLQSLEGNVLVYADVFLGDRAVALPNSNGRTNLDDDLRAGSTNAWMFAFEGVQQAAFLPLSDLVLWRSVLRSNELVRLRVRVMVLRTKEEKDLFDIIASLVGQFNASPLNAQQVQALGGILAKLKPDSIELFYDVTFSPGQQSTNGSLLVLPLQTAQFAVIKGESGYRDAAFGSYLAHYAVPFNWLGATVPPPAQKREIGNENDDAELFQYSRYSKEKRYLKPLAYLAETTWSAVRLPFYLVFWTFKRPWTRDSGTEIEALVWEHGELRIDNAEKKPRSEKLYTEKSYMVFSVSRVK